MLRKQFKLVSNIDRLVRFVLGLGIVTSAYVLDITNLQFVVHHIVTLLIWLTAAYSWDPFYAVAKKLQRVYEERAVMNGRF